MPKVLDATSTMPHPQLRPNLLLEDITGAINNFSPLRQFFLTYLRGRTSQTANLTDDDVRKLLNSPSPSVFKEMVIAAVAQYERIHENVRAQIHEIMPPAPQYEPNRHQHLDDEAKEIIMWRSIADDAPKKILKPQPRYSATYIEHLLIKYRLLLPSLVTALTTLFANFQKMLNTHRAAYMELARQHQFALKLTPMHARHLPSVHQAYRQAATNAERNNIVHRFAVLQGAPLPEDRLHRFFRSGPLMTMVPRHRAERDDIMLETVRHSRDIRTCQQAILNPGSPLYYEMNEILRNNPNFEFVPRPGRDRHNVSQTLREQETRQRDLATPFPLRPECRPD